VVDYFTIPELPEQQRFRCDKRNASLSVESCAGMWRIANDRGAPERLDQCKNCSLGAKHAGVGEISLSPLRGMSICGRCHSGTTRLIRGHLCPSCYNRELEYTKGRNARGTLPITHPVLHELSIRFQCGELTQKLSIKAVSSEELVIAALRDSSKQVTFSFNRPKCELPQGELF
jgi:hypothetical protein